MPIDQRQTQEHRATATRVCMIVHAYYLKDARVRRYAETLVSAGFSVDVLCLREGGEPPFEHHNGVNIYRINLAHRRSGTLGYMLEYFLSFVGFFTRINILYLQGNRYRLIHVHNFPNFLVFAAAIQKLLGARVILDVHDPMPELFRSKFRIDGPHPLLRLLYFEERISSRHADFVIAANDYFEKLLVNRSCHRRKTAVILNSPGPHFYHDARALTSKTDPRRTFKILYIGTVAERYGLDTLLKAVTKIKRDGTIPSLQLAVIPKIRNEGDYLDNLLREVARLGLEGVFRLLEPVSNEHMPKIIGDSDVSIYTPRRDAHMDIALSLKIPEAIAIGCPVVASRLSVLETYFGEDALFMCEPGNPDDCAQKIVQVYRDPQSVQLRGQRARQALAKFAWEKQADKYLRIVNKLLGNGQVSLTGTLPARRMRIKRLARKTACFLSHYSGLGYLWYRLFARHAVRILGYHDIESEPGNSYSVSITNLQNQMELLQKHCNVISLDEYRLLRLRKAAIRPDTVVLTFDDGYRSFYKTVYPILKKHGLPGTCFVITSKVDSDDSIFMCWKELREIASDNLVSIGSHSSSHPHLSTLDDQRLEGEIRGSKLEIEKRIGKEVDFFSYPYGTPRDINERCTRLVSAAGYSIACTAINGVNSGRTDPLYLRRTKIEWGDDISMFKKIVRGRLDFWILIDYFFSFTQNKSEVDFSAHRGGGGQEPEVTCAKFMKSLFWWLFSGPVYGRKMQ